jgi:hypothetical protein
MGRMLKNTVFKTGSYTLGVPVGSSAVGPDAPTAGQARWNTSTSRLEYYTGSAWAATAHEGNVTIVKDSFTGDNSNVIFRAMTYSYNAGQESQTLVVVNNVIQNPGVAYTYMGNTAIKFTSAPTASAPIYILHNFASTTAA